MDGGHVDDGLGDDVLDDDDVKANDRAEASFCGDGGLDGDESNLTTKGSKTLDNPFLEASSAALQQPYIADNLDVAIVAAAPSPPALPSGSIRAGPPPGFPAHSSIRDLVNFSGRFRNDCDAFSSGGRIDFLSSAAISRFSSHSSDGNAHVDDGHSPPAEAPSPPPDPTPLGPAPPPAEASSPSSGLELPPSSPSSPSPRSAKVSTWHEDDGRVDDEVAPLPVSPLTARPSLSTESATGSAVHPNDRKSRTAPFGSAANSTNTASDSLLVEGFTRLLFGLRPDPGGGINFWKRRQFIYFRPDP
ncbi:Hypothetical predicted protein, partial [Paramuricea clavata]